MDPSGYCHRKYGVVKVLARSAYFHALALLSRSASALASLALCSCFSFPSASLAFPSHPQNRTGSLSLSSVRPRLPFATRFDIPRFAFCSRFQPHLLQIIFLWSQVSSALSMLLIPIPYSLIPSFQDQALDRLVSPSSIHYCTSTDDLSTLSSSRGLTCF